MSKLFFHTGSTEPTNIGDPGDVLHSIKIENPACSGEVFVKDGERLIFQSLSGDHVWKGVEIESQLSITLAHPSTRVTVELSHGKSDSEDRTVRVPASVGRRDREKG